MSSLERWEPGDIVRPAKLFIAQEVNRHLREHVSPQLLFDRSNELRPYIRPFTLLGAIWFQMYEAFTGGKKASTVRRV